MLYQHEAPQLQHAPPDVDIALKAACDAVPVAAGHLQWSVSPKFDASLACRYLYVDLMTL